MLNKSDLRTIAFGIGILLVFYGLFLITKSHSDVVVAASDTVGGAASLAVGAVIALVAIGGEKAIDKLLDFLRYLFRL